MTLEGRELRATRQMDAWSGQHTDGSWQSQVQGRPACSLHPQTSPWAQPPHLVDNTIKLSPGPMASPQLGFIMMSLYSV